MHSAPRFALIRAFSIGIGESALAAEVELVSGRACFTFSGHRSILAPGLELFECSVGAITVGVYVRRFFVDLKSE